jgi:DNA invertase Pin-like site-specific DNA recombinase
VECRLSKIYRDTALRFVGGIIEFWENVSLLGYARVSTDQQDHALQLDALRAAGCDKLFIETISGSRVDRPELAKLLEVVR